MIFADAEAENMTGEGYAWIVTEQVEKKPYKWLMFALKKTLERLMYDWKLGQLKILKVVDVWLKKTLEKLMHGWIFFKKRLMFGLKKTLQMVDVWTKYVCIVTEQTLIVE